MKLAEQEIIGEKARASRLYKTLWIHRNDIAAYDFTGFSPADYEQQLRDAVD